MSLSKLNWKFIPLSTERKKNVSFSLTFSTLIPKNFDVNSFHEFLHAQYRETSLIVCWQIYKNVCLFSHLFTFLIPNSSFFLLLCQCLCFSHVSHVSDVSMGMVLNTHFPQLKTVNGKLSEQTTKRLGGRIVNILWWIHNFCRCGMGWNCLICCTWWWEKIWKMYIGKKTIRKLTIWCMLDRWNRYFVTVYLRGKWNIW